MVAVELRLVEEAASSFRVRDEGDWEREWDVCTVEDKVDDNDEDEVYLVVVKRVFKFRRKLKQRSRRNRRGKGLLLGSKVVQLKWWYSITVPALQSRKIKVKVTLKRGGKMVKIQKIKIKSSNYRMTTWTGWKRFTRRPSSGVVQCTTSTELLVSSESKNKKNQETKIIKKQTPKK